MNYLLLAPALDDLDHIDDWIVSNFGEQAATKARRKLYSVFAVLAEQQQMGIERLDIASPPIRFFCSPPNWIIYEPGDPLLIHRVYPARTDIRDLTL